MRFLVKHKYTVLVLAVLLPRMLWFAVLDGKLPSPVRDQGFYISLAGRIATGEGLSYSEEIGWLRHRMASEESARESWSSDPRYVFGIIPVETPTASIEPGYPILLGAVFLVTGPCTGGVFLLNCLFALLGAWAVLRLTSGNWGEKQGVLAMLIWSLYPYYIYYSAYAMTDVIHISLLPLVLYLTLDSGKKKSRGILAGAASGFLFLIRSTAVFLLPLQLLWTFIRGNWKTAAALLLGFMLFCAPWMVRNQLELGSPVLLPTKGALNLWMRNNPRMLSMEGIHIPSVILERTDRLDLLEYPSMDSLGTELERSGLIMDRTRDFIMENPLLFSYLTVVRALNFVSPAGSTLDHPLAKLAGFVVYLPLLILGVLELIRRRRDRRVLMLAAVFLLYLILHSLAHGGVRYRLPVDMVLIVLSALFIGRRAGWKTENDPGHDGNST